MKRKRMHKAASILILALALSLAWLCNALFGNPISRMLAEHTARRHLAQEYAGTDFEIERIGYSFKDSNYHAFIRSPSSAVIKILYRDSLPGRQKPVFSISPIICF